MVFVNRLCPVPGFEYDTTKCSRYCEQHGCPHFAGKFSSTDQFVHTWWYRYYRWNVRALNRIPGLNYAEANIAVYFILYPVLVLLLLYNLLKR